MEDILKLNWDDIDSLIDSLSDEIKQSGIKFDNIIALGRGGLIPGAALSYKLNIPNLQNLGIITREKSDHIKTIIYQMPRDLTKESKILIVDDINDSGRTFDSVKSILQSHYEIGEENLYFASLIKRNSTEFDSSNTISGNTVYITSWLQFPWDK